jgi:DNA-binding NarL/FixJ family response regulator
MPHSETNDWTLSEMTDEPKLRVLLVEDAALLIDQVRELLATIGKVGEVKVVSTEHDAIRALADFEPDLAIVDLKLKEGTGFGVLRSLSDVSARPKVIIFTNYSLPNYKQLSEIFGADYFLDKAKDFDTLPNIIESIDEVKPRRRPLLH